MQLNNQLKPDCKHYLGDRPCVENTLCGGCSSYTPYQSRICIIKIGAFGDVIRTTSILPALHNKYPNAHVTWVTKSNAVRLLKEHHLIQRLISFNAMTVMPLLSEQFDIVICLDKESEPCGLMNQLNAKLKLGVGLSPFGTPVPLNESAIDYFNLGLDDNFKFNLNKLSYPALIHQALDLDYDNTPYHLTVHEGALIKAKQILSAQGWTPQKQSVGVNVGSGDVFANKSLTFSQLDSYIKTLHLSQPQAQILLLGGPDEATLMQKLKDKHPYAFHTGAHNDEQTFLGLIDHSDVVLTGDTMALHMAVAREKYVVAYFGPTCEQEIDLYGKGIKLIANVACAPCYKRQCDMGDECVKAITVDQMINATTQLLQQAANTTHTIPLPIHPDFKKVG